MEKIFLGPITKGLSQYLLPFNIDNDAFPTLYNAYPWRGRVKKKRGTIPLGRLQLQLQIGSTYKWQIPSFALVGGAGNLIAQIPGSTSISAITKAANAQLTVGSTAAFSVGQAIFITGVVGMTQINENVFNIVSINPSGPTITIGVDSTLFTTYVSGGTISPNASIVPGSISIVVGANIYTDHAPPDGTLVGSPAGSGTINYATGDFTITGGGSTSVTGNSNPSFSYYPELPVMGLEDFIVNSSAYPSLLAFDTKYSYQTVASTNSFYNTTYYKANLLGGSTITNVPFTWSGANFQQFWTTNYQGALWATNDKPGLHYANATYSSGSGSATITMNLKDPTGANITYLVLGEYIYFNEWNASGVTINGIVGRVTSIAGAASGNYVITFTGNQTVSSTGKAFLLTDSVVSSTGAQQDGIRWYDGDPTNSGIPPTSVNGLGWVNFSPPINMGASTIDDQPPKVYYLAGATSVVPFKDRLVFFSPWIQATDGSSPVKLNDVALWSWNGTPYYTCSIASTLTTVPTAILVPSGQTADQTAYYTNVTGKGGWLSAGLDQFIVTVTNNEDVLLVGFTGKQTRFVYTGNDLFPFLFYIVNSELGSAATFSGITLDQGALSFGLNGLVMTTQIGAQRIDMDIPNQVFQLQGPESSFAARRISSARDFYHEWVYFTFVPNTSRWQFPTQTLQYNYRESSWSLHYENYTSHGSYRSQTGYTWATIPFNSWADWNETWNSSSLSALFPNVIAGNPQGFVVIKGQGTGEAPTGYIASITNNLGSIQITSADHCVAANDYLYFLSALGTTYINGIVGKVQIIIDANNFVVDIPFQTGTYLGQGTFTRLIQPLIQTKQFAPYWNEGRQVILGAQKYLMDWTDSGQVTLYIYLSQDPDDAWNAGPIVPSNETLNSSLVYSTVLFTSPEYPIQSVFNAPLGTIGNGTSTTINIDLYTLLKFNNPIVPNSVVITIGSLATFTDNGAGGFNVTGTGLSLGSSILYNSGFATLVFSSAASATISTITMQYTYNNIQTPTANSQYQIWHRLNTSLIGESFQVGITLNDAQMRNVIQATSEITLNAAEFTVSKGPLLS